MLAYYAAGTQSVLVTGLSILSFLSFAFIRLQTLNDSCHLVNSMWTRKRDDDSQSILKLCWKVFRVWADLLEIDYYNSSSIVTFLVSLANKEMPFEWSVVFVSYEWQLLCFFHVAIGQSAKWDVILSVWDYIFSAVFTSQKWPSIVDNERGWWLAPTWE